MLHPSAFVQWFEGAPRSSLRAEFEAGNLEILVPRSFIAESMAAFAVSGWPVDRLVRLADAIRGLGIRVDDPPFEELAPWLARGLSPSDASYAALAAWHDLPLAVAEPGVRAATATLPHDPA